VYPEAFLAPKLVWFGPKAPAPEGCTGDLGSVDVISYFDLQGASSEGCPQCACSSLEGSCSPRPDSIYLHSALCNDPPAPTMDFGAPEDWDGSCSNNHKVAADAECPVSSGIPCAHSIYVSGLPPPKEEGCKPITIPVAEAISDVPKWGKVAFSCNPPPIADDPINPWCHTGVILPYRPNDKAWRYCVRPTQKGVYECLGSNDYIFPILTYPENAIDDQRYCTECGCDVSGSTCYGTFGIYEDDTCTKLLTQDLISSDTSTCSDINPAGLAVGSKQLKDLWYLPGKCEPTGGLPAGTVELDTTDAVLWCCTEEIPTKGE
jgi:hypothetical protein